MSKTMRAHSMGLDRTQRHLPLTYLEVRQRMDSQQRKPLLNWNDGREMSALLLRLSLGALVMDKGKPLAPEIAGFQDLEPKWLADWCDKYMAEMKEEDHDAIFRTFTERALTDESFRPFYAMWRWGVKHHALHHKVDMLGDMLGAPSGSIQRAMKALGLKDLPAHVFTLLSGLLQAHQEGKSPVEAADLFIEALKGNAEILKEKLN